jgi:hypothetical protein
MRVIAVVGALVCALVVPTLASAGGWASVGFEPLPDGTEAGGTWNATIFVKQHGVTPLEGLQPVVMIEKSGSTESSKVLATPGDEPGVYHADVLFPSAGDWRVTILSGFGESKATYGPITVGGAAAGDGSEPLPVIGFAVLALAVVGAFGVLAARRLRRLTPASG